MNLDCGTLQVACIDQSASQYEDCVAQVDNGTHEELLETHKELNEEYKKEVEKINNMAEGWLIGADLDDVAVIMLAKYKEASAEFFKKLDKVPATVLENYCSRPHEQRVSECNRRAVTCWEEVVRNHPI